MKIRFMPDMAPCKWSHVTEEGKMIEVSLKAIDQLDIISWSKSSEGFKVPDEAWIADNKDGKIVRVIDFDLLSPDQRKALEMDDFRLAASKVVLISGIIDEESGKDISEFSLEMEDKASVLYLLAKEYHEFHIFLLTWLSGAKKKSGKVVAN